MELKKNESERNEITLEQLQEQANKINADIDSQLGFWPILKNIGDPNAHSDAIRAQFKTSLNDFDEKLKIFCDKTPKQKEAADAIKKKLGDDNQLVNFINYKYFYAGGVLYSIPVIVAMCAVRFLGDYLCGGKR